jgi:hypothetical protein
MRREPGGSSRNPGRGCGGRRHPGGRVRQQHGLAHLRFHRVQRFRGRRPGVFLPARSWGRWDDGGGGGTPPGRRGAADRLQSQRRGRLGVDRVAHGAVVGGAIVRGAVVGGVGVGGVGVGGVGVGGIGVGVVAVGGIGIGACCSAFGRGSCCGGALFGRSGGGWPAADPEPYVRVGSARGRAARRGRGRGCDVGPLRRCPIRRQMAVAWQPGGRGAAAGQRGFRGHHRPV